jgi:hypothetical protein
MIRARDRRNGRRSDSLHDSIIVSYESRKAEGATVGLPVNRVTRPCDVTRA